MEKTMNRKQFFHEALLQVARISVELTQGLAPATKNQPTPTHYAFEADFPPELLADEAKNMGLNPDDKNAVLAAIAEKLKPPEV